MAKLVNKKFAIVIVISFACLALLLRLNKGQGHLEGYRKSLTSVNLPVTPQLKSPHGSVSGTLWMEYFSFLEDNIVNCEELFSNADKSDPFPENYKLLIQEHKEALKSSKITEGYSFQNLEEAMVMYELAKLPFVRTVCETGFNAGHSTVAWLAAKPDMQVFSFDMGSHPYARDISKWFKRKFGDRFTITWGDSMETLPKFRADRPKVKCDLIIVDGGHTYAPALSDFKNFYEMASADSVVLFDNYPDYEFPNLHYMEELGPVWAQEQRIGHLLDIFHCLFEKNKHGFSVGRFIK